MNIDELWRDRRLAGMLHTHRAHSLVAFPFVFRSIALCLLGTAVIYSEIPNLIARVRLRTNVHFVGENDFFGEEKNASLREKRQNICKKTSRIAHRIDSSLLLCCVQAAHGAVLVVHYLSIRSDEDSFFQISMTFSFHDIRFFFSFLSRR